MIPPGKMGGLFGVGSQRFAPIFWSMVSGIRALTTVALPAQGLDVLDSIRAAKVERQDVVPHQVIVDPAADTPTAAEFDELLPLLNRMSTELPAGRKPLRAQPLMMARDLVVEFPPQAPAPTAGRDSAPIVSA